jgi:hypothetical protein
MKIFFFIVKEIFEIKFFFFNIQRIQFLRKILLNKFLLLLLFLLFI